MTNAIEVRGLGKRFHHRLPRYRTLVGRLRGAWEGRETVTSAWALKDVGFDVRPGECVGITGPNGSGKTTLLSLIAGILEPTQGEVRLNGAANTFFSLDAGLQKDLSVLDNVEICGVLMGLRRREVLRRAEAILDFAELPSKAELRMGELSSGQAARVVFATAMHADLDVFLVDEALSVGDASFREKCRAAFARLRSQGKTLLVVSHDDDVLKSLEARVLRLEAGRLLSPLEAGARA